MYNTINNICYFKMYSVKALLPTITHLNIYKYSPINR